MSKDIKLPKGLEHHLKGLQLKPGEYEITSIVTGHLFYQGKPKMPLEDFYKTTNTYKFIVPENHYLSHGNGD